MVYIGNFTFITSFSVHSVVVSHFAIHSFRCWILPIEVYLSGECERVFYTKSDLYEFHACVSVHRVD